jgi:prepilin peptidase CpaA
VLLNFSQSVVIVVAAAACVTDLRSRRIPNVLTFGAALAGLVFHVITGGFAGFEQAIGGWTVGAMVFAIPFALGGLGAGDVKLLAALGAWLGPVTTLWLALYTGVAGGIGAVVVALANGYLHTALTNISVLLLHWRANGLHAKHEISLEGSSGPKLAYALPIFGGLLATLWLR